jgi:hypothetical protein
MAVGGGVRRSEIDRDPRVAGVDDKAMSVNEAIVLTRTENKTQFGENDQRDGGSVTLI